MKIQSLLLTMAAALTLCGGENLLNSVPWRIATSKGGKMTATRQGDVVVVERVTAEGGTIYLPRKDFPIAAGKTYEASISFKSLTPGAKAAVMVQTNDASRRPFPTSGYQVLPDGGKVTVRLTARDTEKSIRIMLTMPVPGKIAVDNVELNEIEPDNNLLLDSSIKWGNRVRGGADGKVTYHSDKTITLNRNNKAGHVLIVNDSPIALTPGSEYNVDMAIAAGNAPVAARMVMQFPGSTRRAQTVTIRLDAGKAGNAKFQFTANGDEKQIKIHLYLDSASSVKIKKIDLIEKKN